MVIDVRVVDVLPQLSSGQEVPHVVLRREGVEKRGAYWSGATEWRMISRTFADDVSSADWSVDRGRTGDRVSIPLYPYPLRPRRNNESPEELLGVFHTQLGAAVTAWVLNRWPEAVRICFFFSQPLHPPQDASQIVLMVGIAVKFPK